MLANFADEAPIAQWARGFLHGHQWLEELWEECLPEELQEESSCRAGGSAGFWTSSGQRSSAGEVDPDLARPRRGDRLTPSTAVVAG